MTTQQVSYSDDHKLEMDDRKSEAGLLNRIPEHLKRCESFLRKWYISNGGEIKEYVVCVPVDHSTNSNDPPLQNGVIMLMTSYDQTRQSPISFEYLLYNTPMEAKFARDISRDLNRDGSPIFGGYVFGDMKKYMKFSPEKLSQLLIDEVATNQFDSVNSSEILSTNSAIARLSLGFH